jgi:anhydro-N-acetylmuramic acid kinase
MMVEYEAIGLMSGSSLDGLDAALCAFSISPDAERPLVDWKLRWGRTFPFTGEWRRRLRELPGASALELAQAHVDFGHYMGELIKPHLPARLDLIASHGHTIFHFPERRLTLQIGDGAALAAACGCTVVDDFRSLDVALGGQGAPLAPLADQWLFPGFDFYLNLGGIANISARLPGERFVAFDVSGANQTLDALAQTLGMAYDKDGAAAAAGRLLPELLAEADRLEYFDLPYPKSLGNDWVRERLTPLYLNYLGTSADKLHTACEQLARQVARAVELIVAREGLREDRYRMFVSGGGALNRHLMRRLEANLGGRVALKPPAAEFIAFKEAALMALMGTLRLLGRSNCLASVTGAAYDARGGAAHLGGPFIPHNTV